jgi:tetratricopeptide (TPR) repeat protein
LRPGRRGGLLALVALGAWACVHPTPTRFPEGEDYVFPSWRVGEVRPDEARRIEKAWRAVLAGEAAAAAEGFRKLLAARPGLVPAETGLAYAQLRGGRRPEAASTFAAVLARRPDYLPALVGAASAAIRQADPEGALQLYRRAQAVAPEDAVVRKRLAEMKLRLTERGVAEGRAALAAGDEEKAIAEYRRVLEYAPELAGLRLDLAALLVSHGDPSGAADVLEADPGQDRQVMARLGEILIGLGEYERALGAYRVILARDPKDAEALRRSREAREALEFEHMPEEYRRIPTAPRLSRADLAALISVKVTALSRLAARDPKVAIDISGSWAREHIVSALALDIMDVYPNHTFQPGAIVRRGDLARAAARILDLFRWARASGPTPTDMTPSNLFYDAAVRVAAAGLMELTASGAFEPWRPVSGRDAQEVVEGLVRLVGP